VSAESGQLLLSPERCSGDFKQPTSERLCPSQPECHSEVQPQQAGHVITRHEEDGEHHMNGVTGDRRDQNVVQDAFTWRTGDWSEVRTLWDHKII